MSQSQTDIFHKAVSSALDCLACATDEVMSVDMSRYPHMKAVAVAIGDAAALLENGRNVKPIERLVTVIINDDNREWDDPYICIVDALGCETAEDLRGVVIKHYDDAFNSDELVTAYEYWKDSGAVILSVTPGAVQMGWQRGGVDDTLLDDILRSQPHEVE